MDSMNRRGALTRRKFVQLAAVASAGIAAGGALQACTANEADSAATETIEADIIVVGGGIGGLGAALRAAEEGKNIILLEKESNVGGDSALSDGTIHAAGTTLQEEQGYGGDTTDSYIELRKSLEPDPVSSNPGEPLSHVLYDGALVMVEDLHARGLEFVPLEDWDPQAHFVEGKGAALVAFVEDLAVEAGAQIETSTQVDSLVTDNGQVVGVMAGNTQYKAKAVILATGGFTRSEELVHEYIPFYDGVLVVCSMGVTGDGLVMAQDIGAADLLLESGAHSYFICPDNLADMSIPGSSTPGIDVNIEGDRFHNEEEHYDTAGKHGIEQPEHKAFFIFDDNIKTNYAEVLDAYFEMGVVSGPVAIDKLAEDLGTPNLAATLTHYNEMMATGVDADYGREFFLEPIAGPNYYSIPMEACIYYTYGGLDIDTQAHVLDTSGEPITGLFACGEVCVSTEKREGLLYTSGLSQGYVFGQIAVDTAIDELGV